jgi:uncharacterized protein
MIKSKMIRFFKVALLSLLCLITGISLQAQVTDFPDKPSPPRLVNDLAGMMSPDDAAKLERKLQNFEVTTSNEITIVTVTSIGEYDISDYAIKLGKKWTVGKSGKNNGVVVLAAANEHKIFIASGKGLEGALTDYTCGKIRDNMKPFFRTKDFYGGFDKATDDIIAATKGEFKGEPRAVKSKRFPFTAIIVIVIVLILITRIGGGKGKGPGGNYISGGGFGNFAAGWFLGELLSGGRRGGGSWGGNSGGSWGGGESGGGFGGFGGGDFGGGGAGGSWD